MARRSPRPVAAALDTLLERTQPQTALAAAQRVWREAVGEAIASQAEPVSERAGVVTIACSSAVWAAELDLMKPDLEERLKERLGTSGLFRLRFVTKPL